MKFQNIETKNSSIETCDLKERPSRDFHAIQRQVYQFKIAYEGRCLEGSQLLSYSRTIEEISCQLTWFVKTYIKQIPPRITVQISQFYEELVADHAKKTKYLCEQLEKVNLRKEERTIERKYNICEKCDSDLRKVNIERVRDYVENEYMGMLDRLMHEAKIEINGQLFSEEEDKIFFRHLHNVLKNKHQDFKLNSKSIESLIETFSRNVCQITVANKSNFKESKRIVEPNEQWLEGIKESLGSLLRSSFRQKVPLFIQKMFEQFLIQETQEKRSRELQAGCQTEDYENQEIKNFREKVLKLNGLIFKLENEVKAYEREVEVARSNIKDLTQKSMKENHKFEVALKKSREREVEQNLEIQKLANEVVELQIQVQRKNHNEKNLQCRRKSIEQQKLSNTVNQYRSSHQHPVYTEQSLKDQRTLRELDGTSQRRSRSKKKIVRMVNGGKQMVRKYQPNALKSAVSIKDAIEKIQQDEEQCVGQEDSQYKMDSSSNCKPLPNSQNEPQSGLQPLKVAHSIGTVNETEEWSQSNIKQSHAVSIKENAHSDLNFDKEVQPNQFRTKKKCNTYYQVVKVQTMMEERLKRSGIFRHFHSGKQTSLGKESNPSYKVEVKRSDSRSATFTATLKKKALQNNNAFHQQHPNCQKEEVEGALQGKANGQAEKGCSVQTQTDLYYRQMIELFENQTKKLISELLGAVTYSDHESKQIEFTKIVEVLESNGVNVSTLIKSRRESEASAHQNPANSESENCRPPIKKFVSFHSESPHRDSLEQSPSIHLENKMNSTTACSTPFRPFEYGSSYVRGAASCFQQKARKGLNIHSSRKKNSQQSFVLHKEHKVGGLKLAKKKLQKGRMVESSCNLPHLKLQGKNSANEQQKDHLRLSDQAEESFGVRIFCEQQDLELFFNEYRAYLYECSHTKHYHKTALKRMTPQQEKYLLFIFENLQLIGKRNRQAYQEIISFIRYPFQTVKGNSLGPCLVSSLNLQTYLQLMGKILSIHEKCKSDFETEICQHVELFGKKIMVVLSQITRRA